MNELSKQLRLGMSLNEVENILGPHSSQTTAGEVMGMFANVAGFANSNSSLSNKKYITWRRPEGNYELVFSGDVLVNLYSVPK